MGDELAPVCFCNEPCALRVCMKEGPNKGRTFYTCANGTCKTFKPADGKPWTRTPNAGPFIRASQPVQMKRKRDEESDAVDIIECGEPRPKLANLAKDFLSTAKEFARQTELEESTSKELVSATAKTLAILAKAEKIVAILEKLCPPGCIDAEHVADQTTAKAPAVITTSQ